MFCEKCGRPVDDDQFLCSDCAAQEASISPEETTDDVFDLNIMADPEPEKKPSKKKRLVAIIALVAAAALAGLFYFDVGGIAGFVKGFFGRNFQEPQEYLADVESDAITEQSNKLTNAYGEWLGTLQASLNATTSSAQMELIIGDDLIDLADLYMDTDIAWLKNAKLSINSNSTESAIQIDMGLALSKSDILSGSLIMDLDDAMLYMGLPSVNSTYLGFDLIDMGIDPSIYAYYTEVVTALIAALPSEDELSTLISTYSNVILSCIDDVEKSEKTITIDDVSQKVVVLSAKITPEDMLIIAEKVLDKAENDKTLKNVIDDLSDYANTVNAASGDPDLDLYALFQENLPALRESIEQQKDSVNNDSYIKVNVYVDMQNNLRGHELFIYEDGEELEDHISWLSVAKGDTVYTEAVFPGAKLEGSETSKKGVSKGEYTLYVEDEKIATLKFENVTATSGTFRLYPSEAILAAALSETGLPVSFLSGNIGIELSYEAKNDTSTSTIAIVMGSDVLLGLKTTSSFANGGGDITIPSDVTYPDGMADMQNWLSDCDFDATFDAMDDANVPTEIINAIKTMVESNLRRITS